MINQIQNISTENAMAQNETRLSIQPNIIINTPVGNDKTSASQKISEKNYLGSNFAVFVREIRRKRKSVSSGGNFFFLEITMILERKLRNH